MEPGLGELIKQWGAFGVILASVAIYLVKKELAWQVKEKAFQEMLENRHKEFVGVIKDDTVIITQLNQELKELRTEVAALKQLRGGAP